VEEAEVTHPPPSWPPGLKAWVPRVIWPSPVRKAQPVVEPRSSARTMLMPALPTDGHWRR
jgi:hypothetical protein